MLLGVPERIKARMRIAQLRRTEAQVVQQRIYPRLRNVLIMGAVPTAIEKWVRVTTLIRAEGHVVVQRVRPLHVLVALHVPRRVEQDLQITRGRPVHLLHAQ